MKIKVTEISCNANELRQSNTLADSLSTILRGCFNPYSFTTGDEEEEESE